MKKNNGSITLVLLAVCVMIWTVNVIVDIAFNVGKNRFIKLLLDSIFLAIWIAAFVAIRKKNGQDHED